MQYPVLDKGFVELLDMMPQENADLAIVTAARTSYLSEGKGEKADKKLLRYLYENQHMSPFEMVEFKFLVRAPAFVCWQWVRHRTWSYNFQSGRYTEAEEDGFYIPDEWRLQNMANKQGSDGYVDDDICVNLDEMIRGHAAESFRLYKAAIDYGVAREQARLFLPAWGLYYTFVAKVDLRNLMHFLKLRMTDHAQYEIRVYALAIMKIFKDACPWTYDLFCEDVGLTS